MDKKYYKELKTIKDVINTLPEHVRHNDTVIKNTKFFFKELKRQGKRDSKIYLVKFFCPTCECYEKMHMVIMKNDKGKKDVFKEKFEKDEPMKMMCQKCMDRSMYLYESGIIDKELVMEVLKDMGEEDKHPQDIAM